MNIYMYIIYELVIINKYKFKKKKYTLMEAAKKYFQQYIIKLNNNFFVC